MDQTVPIIKSAGYMIEDVIERVIGKSPASPAGPFTPYIDKKPVFLPSNKLPPSAKAEVRDPPRSRSKSEPVLSKRKVNEEHMPVVPEIVASVTSSPEPFHTLPVDERPVEAPAGSNPRKKGSRINSKGRRASSDASFDLERNRGSNPPLYTSYQTYMNENALPASTSRSPGSKRTAAEREADLAAFRASNASKRQDKKAQKKLNSRLGSQIPTSSTSVRTTLSRQLGDNLRSYVEGMVYGSSVEVITPEAPSVSSSPPQQSQPGFTKPQVSGSNHLSQLPTVVGSKLSSGASYVKKTEMKRVIGDNSRTHLEGLALNTKAATTVPSSSHDRHATSSRRRTELQPLQTSVSQQNRNETSSRPRIVASMRPSAANSPLPSSPLSPTCTESFAAPISTRPENIARASSAQRTIHYRQIGNNDRTHLEGMSAPTKAATSARPPPSSRAKETSIRCSQIPIMSEHRRVVGNNERTHLEGMSPLTKAPTSSDSMTPPSRSRQSKLPSRMSTESQTPLSDGNRTVVPRMQNVSSRNPGSMSDSRAQVATVHTRRIGNNERTHLEGLRAGTTVVRTSANTVVTAPTTVQSPSRKSSEISSSTHTRAVGNNDRTYLEGMSPAMNTATSIPESRRYEEWSTPGIGDRGPEDTYDATEEDNQVTADEPVSEQGYATEYSRHIGDNMRTYAEGMEPDEQDYASQEAEQDPDYDDGTSDTVETVMQRALGDNMRTHLEGMEAVQQDDEYTTGTVMKNDQDTNDDDMAYSSAGELQTTMKRVLGDNMRTHLEGMEDSEEIDRMIEEKDPLLQPTIQSQYQRELGNNHRSYIEGMVEEEDDENTGKKPTRRFWQRKRT